MHEHVIGRCAVAPLSRLLVHDQRDVALDQREGEEADVAGVLAGASGLLRPAEERKGRNKKEQ